MTSLASERDYVAWATPRLERLSRRQRAAFAAAVAERQMGTYTCFARKDPRLKPHELRQALDIVWDYAAGEKATVLGLNDAQERIKGLIPNLEATDAPDQAPLIEDAVAAVFYAVQACLSDDPMNARAAGRCTLDAVATWVFGMLFPSGIEGTDEARRGQHTIDQHPLMVREFEQMQREMEFLRNQPTVDKSICSDLRQLWSNGTKSNIDLD